MPFTEENRNATLALFAVLVSVFLIGAGGLFYLADKDNDRRDAADAAYADCLTEFAADLVSTIKLRSEATVQLENAAEAKSVALDRLLRVTRLYRRNPPEASDQEFDRALEARVIAQDRYDRVAATVDMVREDNAYVSPEVVCTR